MAKREEELPLVEDLRRAVLDSGLTQSELGRRAGVSQPQLSRFLNRERTLTLTAAAKLCRALGLTLVKQGEPAPQPGTRQPSKAR
jgi:transcriptional regulator with XRE-family HTH domain